MRLVGNWSPALQIRTILLSIQALLGAPNPDDPLANDVAQQWKENEQVAIDTGEFISFPSLPFFLLNQQKTKEKKIHKHVIYHICRASFLWSVSRYLYYKLIICLFLYSTTAREWTKQYAC